MSERCPACGGALRASASAPEPPSRFRAVGMTAEAENWPLSGAACAIKAEQNGVAVELLPELLRYASNAYHHAWYARLAIERERGNAVRDPDGRWWTPRRLEAAYGN